MLRTKHKAIVCDIDETLIVSGLLADIHLNSELYASLTKYKKRHGYKLGIVSILPKKIKLFEKGAV